MIVKIEAVPVKSLLVSEEKSEIFFGRRGKNDLIEFELRNGKLFVDLLSLFEKTVGVRPRNRREH